jgi:uncharacterized membrane protein
MKPEKRELPLDRDARIELLVTKILRLGVGLSVVILTIGMVLVFVKAPPDLSSPQALPPLIEPGAVFPHTVGQVLARFDDFSPPAVIAVGLFVLISTPIVRVAVSLVGFALSRNGQYTVLTAIVLVILTLSILLGETG